MIPKVFHRIWLDEPVPDRFEGYWQAFQQLHPGWEFVTWDDSSQLGWMRDRAVFDAASTHAGRADVLRYEIMYEHGGVYVDTDVEPLRAWDELLDGAPFAGWEDQRLICITVLGSEPGHRAFKAVLDYLPRWTPSRLNLGPNIQTGPVPFTKVWRARKDVRLFPPVAFYPVHWTERDQLGGPYPPESFCVHHWAAGWQSE